MNNPLLFTDPSGYRPDLIFEEEQRISAGQDFGGGGGGSWDPFGWINRSMSYVGWTDNVGPSRADYDYWAANIRGNAAFGEAANSVGKWYQNRRNLQVNWEIALEMGMEFLSTDYQYGGNDIFYTNSNGRSGYLRSRLAVLVDQIIDKTNLSYLESLGQSPRGYGMMLGDPPNKKQELVASGLISELILIPGGGISLAYGTIKWNGKDYGIGIFGIGGGIHAGVGVSYISISADPNNFNIMDLNGSTVSKDISIVFGAVSKDDQRGQGYDSFSGGGSVTYGLKAGASYRWNRTRIYDFKNKKDPTLTEMYMNKPY